MFFALLVITLSAVVFVGCEKTIVNVIPLANVQVCPPAEGAVPCPEQVTLLEEESVSLEARLTGPDGEVLSGRQVTWRTDEPGVATINSTGTLQAVSPGATFAHAQVETLAAAMPVMVLKGPTIALSSQLLQLQGPSGEETPLEIVILVENSGNGDLPGLSVSVAMDGGEEEDWLAATLQSDTAPTTLIVQAFLQDLESGLYGGTLTIVGPTALNSPQTVRVELQVGDELPKIQLDPPAVQFVAPSGAFQPAIQDVSVEDIGGGGSRGTRGECGLRVGWGDWVAFHGLCGSDSAHDARTLSKCAVSSGWHVRCNSRSDCDIGPCRDRYCDRHVYGSMRGPDPSESAISLKPAVIHR